MRWLVRLAVAGTLSAVAVAALTWAGWPRPRSVRAIDTPPGRSVAFSNWHDHSSPYRLIGESGEGLHVLGYPPSHSAEAYWFLAPDGRLLGPWRPGARRQVLGFDSAGRLLAGNYWGVAGYELVRYDPETGTEETLVSVAGPATIESRMSDDRSTLVLAAGEPPVFDVYDVADGRRRNRLTFPDRVGGLNTRRTRVAAHDWVLSPDGRELVLCEAWDGENRLGPPGVEVYDLATGRLVRRLDHQFGLAEPTKTGTDVPKFRPESGVLGYALTRRDSSGGDREEWYRWRHDDQPSYRWDYATGQALTPLVPVLTPRPNRHECEVARDGGRSLWLRFDPAEYRVITSAASDAVWKPHPHAGRHSVGVGVVTSDAVWQPLPGELSRRGWFEAQPLPGHLAAVYRYSDANLPAPTPWSAWLVKWLRLPPATLGNQYFYHDWSAGEFRRVPAGRDSGLSFAVGPRDLAILSRTPTGDTLSLWDLPPPGYPWPWSVPAGVALGALLTAAAVRLRRRRLPAPSH